MLPSTRPPTMRPTENSSEPDDVEERSVAKKTSGDLLIFLKWRIPFDAVNDEGSFSSIEIDESDRDERNKRIWI
ncbi:hypothetical protein L1887_13891 [Cichorium endivia]|nr:hypothetical protein L1887_13891 [Cichorium endivia]